MAKKAKKNSARLQMALAQDETRKNAYRVLIDRAMPMLHTSQLEHLWAVVAAFRDCQSVQADRLLHTIFGKPAKPRRSKA